MTPVQATRWLDMKCEKAMTMDESAKFDQCAALIWAMVKVCQAAEDSLDCRESCMTCQNTIKDALSRLKEITGE